MDSCHEQHGRKRNSSKFISKEMLFACQCVQCHPDPLAGIPPRPGAGIPPPRLLTEEEYRLQGEEETRKALEELRNYCRSPDFSAWTAISRIHSPKRFAEFVGGACHITPSEVTVHEWEYGLGSSFLEEQLFEEEEEEEKEDDDSFDENHGSYSLTHNHLDAH